MTHGGITIGSIKRAVAVRYGVSVCDLDSARRTADVMWPRRLAMYLARTMTKSSLPAIGARFAKRDHTTVFSAVRKARREIATNEFLAEDVADIERELRAESVSLLGIRLVQPEIAALETDLNALGLELVIMPLGTRDETGFPKKKNGNDKTGAEE